MTGHKLSRIFHGCYLVLFTILFLCVWAWQDHIPALLAIWASVLVLLVLVSRKLCAGPAADRRRCGRAVADRRFRRETLADRRPCGVAVTDRQLKFITAAVLCIMAVLLAIVGWMMIPLLRTDLGTVYYSAMEIIQDGHVNDAPSIYNKLTTITNMTNNEYFVVYPNNLPILFLITTFYRIVHAFGISMETDLGVYMGVLLNMGFILFSVGLGSRVAKRLWGNKAALFYLMLAALFVPYYINVSRFYTDTLTLPFPLLAVYLYIRLREKCSAAQTEKLSQSHRFKTQLPWLAGLGACLAVGFLLKGSCIIMAVAILVHALISVFNRRTLAGIAAAAVCFGLIWQGWNVYVHHCSWIDMSREEELTFPATHWVMMAMSGNGGFHQDDFDYTWSFDSKEEKQAANIRKIREKIGNMGGFGGFISFELQKMAGTWGDAKFAQQPHLNWIKKDTVMQEFVEKDGKYHTAFYLYTTAFILVIYTLFMVSITHGIFRKNNMASLFNICIFGVMLFFAFWETKSRYLLNFTPIFFLCATDGMRNLLNYLQRLGRWVRS